MAVLWIASADVAPPTFNSPMAELWLDEWRKIEARELRLDLDDGMIGRSGEKTYLLSLDLQDGWREKGPAPIYSVERIIEGFNVSLHKAPMNLGGDQVYYARYNAGANQTVFDLFIWNKDGMKFIKGGPFYSDIGSITLDENGTVKTGNKVETWGGWKAPCETTYQLKVTKDAFNPYQSERVSVSETCAHITQDPTTLLNTGPDGLRYWVCLWQHGDGEPEMPLLTLERGSEIDLLTYPIGAVEWLASGRIDRESDEIFMYSNDGEATAAIAESLYRAVSLSPASEAERNLVMKPADLVYTAVSSGQLTACSSPE